MNIDDPMAIGDRVHLRKAHPCGSFEWDVFRIGADIGIRCTGCGRRVLVARGAFVKQVKQLIHYVPTFKEEHPTGS